MKINILVFLILIKSFVINAQLPIDCNKFYLHTPPNIQTFNPATNTYSNNSIICPANSTGLAVSNNLNAPTPNLTFYTLVAGQYYYYDGSTWINTGHNATNINAQNICGAGPFIFNFVSSTQSVYRYDGTGNDVLVLTDPSWNGGPLDLIGDDNGNFYLLYTNVGAKKLVKYSPNGVALCTYTLIGMPNEIGGAGYAIVNNKIYIKGLSGSWQGTITGNTINISPLAGLPAIAVDFASCPFPQLTSNISSLGNLTCAASSSVVLTATTNVTGPSYNWSGPGIITNPNSNVVTVNAPGIYTIVVTGSGGVCPGASTSTIAISQIGNPPSANASISNSITCSNSTINLNASPSAMNYTWSAPAGSSVVSGINSQNAIGNGGGTYTITVEDPIGGCTSFTTVSVPVNTVIPSVSINLPSILTCNTHTISLGTTTPNNLNYTWTGPGIVSGGNSSSPIVNQPGIYNLTVVDQINGCSTSTSVNVINDITPPTISSSVSNEITCVSNTVNIVITNTFSPVTYNWAGSGIISSTNTASVTVNQSGIYTYTVTNDNNGCSTTGVQLVTQNTSLPNITMPNTQTITCFSSSVSLIGSANPSSSSPVWTGGVCSGSLSYSASACSSGIYTLTVSDPINGCSNTGTVAVITNTDVPIVTSSNTGSITCSNTSVQVIATTTTVPVSYFWSGPSTVLGFMNSSGTVNTGGTYTCLITNTINGCSTSITSFVPTNTIAVPVSITPASSITCIASTQTLNALPIGSQYSYSWTGTGIVSGDTTSNPVINLGGNFIVLVTNTITGCTGTNTVIVPQDNIAPTITITPSSYTTTCAVPNVSLTTNTSVSSLTYNWSSPSTGSLNDTTIANPIASGSGIFTVVVTNTVNGCSSPLSQATVSIFPDAAIPTLTLSSNNLTITCANPTPSVSVNTSTSSVSYSWSPSSGIISGANTANPVFNSPGSYSVIVTNTINSCSTSQSGNVVTVVSNTTIPVITLSSSSNSGTLTCSNNSITVTPTITPNSNLTYTWSPGIGMATPINQANATFTAVGVYSLVVTNTITGCVSISTSLANTYTISSNTNTPTVTVVPTSTNTTIGCGLNTNVTFSVNVTSSSGNVNYSWFPGGITTPNFSVTTTGIYTVIATDISNNCFTITQFTVNGNSNIPDLTSNLSANFPCGALTTTLGASSTNTNVSYLWTGPLGAVILGGTTNTPTVDVAGNYIVTVTDLSTGCTNSNTVSVSQTTITALFTANPTTGYAPLMVEFTNQTVGATNYDWIFGNGQSSSNLNPNTIYNESGTYTVTLTAYSGTCSSTATITIIVEDGLSLEIPNVFTPNNDGANDIFYIKSSGIKEISLNIFNRWGQKLFEFTGVKAAWDGFTGTGGEVPDGTYFYFVKAIGYDNKIIEKHGTLNLFR